MLPSTRAGRYLWGGTTATPGSEVTREGVLASSVRASNRSRDPVTPPPPPPPPGFPPLSAAALNTPLAIMPSSGTAPDGGVTEVKTVHAKAPAWEGPARFPQYEEDVQVWLHMTTLPDDKKGGAMRMALGGVAKEAARIVPLATLMTASGHDTLLQTLRSAFGGSEFKRGQDAYRHLKTLYRGTRTMEAYLAANRPGARAVQPQRLLNVVKDGRRHRTRPGGAGRQPAGVDGGHGRGARHAR